MYSGKYQEVRAGGGETGTKSKKESKVTPCGGGEVGGEGQPLVCAPLIRADLPAAQWNLLLGKKRQNS